MTDMQIVRTSRWLILICDGFAMILLEFCNDAFVKKVFIALLRSCHRGVI